MSRLPARRRVSFGLGLAALLLLAARPTISFAHPLGNFTVNRYARIEAGPGSLQLRYVVDMAEIPTFQELAQIDADHDGQVSSAEHDQYLAREVAALQGNLHLSADGVALPLTLQTPQLEFLEGQGGLKTLRLSADFVAQLPTGAASTAVSYHDTNFAERIGWQEVVVRANGATLLDSSAPSTDRSNELRSYPQDMLQSPPTLTSASFHMRPGGALRAASSLPMLPNTNGRLPDQFANLIAMPALDAGGLLLALMLAFGLGAAHALAPGHGKTIVAAYLVGARGTARHAVFLGLTTTITHTAGVFALGLVTLLISEFVLPEQLYPWLGVISGVLVLGIGLTLVRGRLRGLLAGPAASDHSHAGQHDLLHDHGDGRMHSHLPPTHQGEGLSWRSLLALGVSGGLLPCPSALVVLLGAIALGRVGFGLLLIVAFSLGLASVLTAIGVLLVYASKLFGRIPSRSPVLRALPVASALLITVAGVGITVQALLQTGIFSL